GVDIDPGACEIAKLRLWLSLIVDEEDIKQIKPLPNLDYKIMQGNSLISEFMGIDLDNDKHNNEKEKLFSTNESNELYEMLKVKKDKLLNQPNINKKKILKKEIENLIIKIFEVKLQEQKSDYFKKLREIEGKYERHPVKEEREKEIKKEKDILYKKTGFNLEEVEMQLRQFTSNRKIRPFFPWKLYFSEVFKEKDGFDVVIANPPYGFRNILSKEEKKYFRKDKGFQFPSGDIAELFIIFSIKKLVHSYGILTFIIPKKSLYGESWREIRQIWVSNRLVYLMDASKAFKNVLLEQVSFSIIKAPNNNENISVGALNQHKDYIEVFGSFSLNNVFLNDYKNAQIYRGMYPESLLEKIMKDSIVNTKQLVKGVIGLSNITSHLTFENNSNYPCVKGIDILRYGLKQNRYLRKEIAKDYLSLFKGDKIVAQEIIAHIQNPFPHILITMFYDNRERLINDTCVEIKVLNHKLNKKFLLAYYQSSFCNWYAYNFIYNRAIRTMHFINYYITQIPIPKIVVEYSNKQEPFISLVNEILILTKDNDYLANSIKQVKVKDYERQIDQMVYKLYDLTEEEVKILEGKK
ncbi:MAG: Eco57I restriction-modification methylase domain-containing protein, partial [Promethearchaeota archaeon]